MNRNDWLRTIEEQFGAEPEYPWNDENAVFRHMGNRKWFALLMRIPRGRLGLAERADEAVDVLNIKCDPLLIGSLRLRDGFHRAYHMNKDKWISVRLDGSVETQEVLELIGLSYALTNTIKKRKDT